MLCTSVYGSVLDVPDGSGGIHVWKAQTNAVDDGNGPAITEGEDLVITVQLRDASNHSMPRDAQPDEGGAFVILAVTETGQSSYDNEDGRSRQVDLIADGYYGLYIADGKSEGSLRIPTRANDSPNSHSTVHIQLRADGWGINTIENARATVKVKDNRETQPGGDLHIDFCPGLPSQIREGQSFQLSLCLDRPSGTAIPIEVAVLEPVATDPFDAVCDGDLAGAHITSDDSYAIPAGVTRYDFPAIEALRDSVFEGDEGFTVFVSYVGELAVFIDSGDATDARDVVIKDATRVHLGLGYTYDLNGTALVDNPAYDATIDESATNRAHLEVVVRQFVFSFNPAYPDSADGNTCSNAGEDRQLHYKVRFSTSTGQDFLREHGTILTQVVPMSYVTCRPLATVVSAFIRDDLYGRQDVTMEVLDVAGQPAGVTSLLSRTSFPQGRTKTFSIDLGTAPHRHRPYRLLPRK